MRSYENYDIYQHSRNAFFCRRNAPSDFDVLLV